MPTARATTGAFLRGEFRAAFGLDVAGAFDGFEQEIAEFDGVTGAGFEGAVVIAEDGAEGGVLKRDGLAGDGMAIPLGGAEGVKDHGEVVNLRGADEIENAVGMPVTVEGLLFGGGGFVFLDAEIEGGHVGGGIGVAAVTLLHHHRDGLFVFADVAGKEDAERPAGIGGKGFVDDLRFGRFGDALFGVIGVGEIVGGIGGIVAYRIIDRVERGAGVVGGGCAFAAEFEGVFDTLDDEGEAFAEEAFAALVGVGEGDVQEVVDLGVVLAGFDAHAIPERDGVFLAALQFDHGFAGHLGEGGVGFEFGGGFLVVAVEVFDGEGLVDEALLAHVEDEHAELGAEVADVVLADDVVAEEFEDARHGVSDDGGAEVADVHLFGDVGAAVVDDDGVGGCDAVDAGAGVSAGEGVVEGLGEEILLQAEVDEARAGDGGRFAKIIDAEVADDAGRDFARGEADAFAEGHGDVALVVGELGIAGFDEGIDHVFRAEGEADGDLEALLKDFVYGLHGGLACWFADAEMRRKASFMSAEW